jgi:outer membrane murein-binding lipoprotein Lpp
MKKSIYRLAIGTLIIGIMIVGCKSNSEKKENAIENVNQANHDLKELEDDQEADKVTKANDEEWQTYKKESNKTIMANATRIKDLRNTMNKSGTTFDKSYAKSIDALEKKNKELINRIHNYENNQTDWESFKREFNSDAAVIATAFKDMATTSREAK